MADILMSIDREELSSNIDRIVNRTMNMDFTWEWPCGVAFYGITKAWEALKKDEYIDFLEHWIDEYIEIGLPPFIVNTVSMGHPLLTLYQATDKQKYLDLAIQKAEHLKNEALRFNNSILQHTVSSKNDFPGQAWADTLFMAAYFLLRLGIQIDNKEYIADALHQFTSHEELLQDSKTNLYYHGYDNQSKGHMSGVLWGRANAWAAISMAETLKMINYLYPEFMLIQDSLRDQLSALVRLQNHSGLWNTVLDNPDTYDESSATAGIAAGLVLNGHPLHAKAILSAYRGLIANISEDGTVFNVSAGTAIMKNKEDYNRIPKKRIQGWGQGLTLAFFSALLKHQDKEFTAI